MLLQQLGAGVGLAERNRVAPQIVQGLHQALVALLVDDLACEGLAALPDALQGSELWRERLLLLDVFLLIILKILLIVADFLLLNDLLLLGVHIACLLCIARRHLAINVFQIAEAT
jgi:hypothetical protein